MSRVIKKEGVVKSPVDNSNSYRCTEFNTRDAVFNWLVKRYGSKGNVWNKSDDVVWGGAIYEVWPWIPALAFIYVTYFIADWIYGHKGAYGAAIFIAVMFLFRLNTLIRLQKHTNALLKQRR